MEGDLVVNITAFNVHVFRPRHFIAKHLSNETVISARLGLLRDLYSL